MSIQQFANTLLRHDWANMMSDDHYVARAGRVREEEFAKIANDLGKNGLRLFELFKKYFWNFSNQSNDSEWRLIGAVLWVNGIKEEESKLKSYVNEMGHIAWSQLRIDYPNVNFITW
jgi:hypothetical protein